MDKITEQDLANRGVKGLPDVPGLTTEEMQRKLEEIAREILIPKVNELVDGLNNANSNLNVIGTIINGEINSVDVPPNTKTKIGSITVPKGTWILAWNGYNPTELYDGGKYTTVEIEGTASIQSKDWVQNSISAVKVVDSNTTFDLNCLHNGASTIKTNKASLLVATRIK